MLRETFSGIQVLAFIKMLLCFDFLFVLLLCVPSQQLCHGGKVSSPNHTFFWAGLNGSGSFRPITKSAHVNFGP